VLGVGGREFICNLCSRPGRITQNRGKGQRGKRRGRELIEKEGRATRIDFSTSDSWKHNGKKRGHAHNEGEGKRGSSSKGQGGE